MRYLRVVFLALLAAVLVSVAVANRGMVTLRLLTDEMAELIGVQNTITLPLFIVILGGVIAGVIVGFVWEWLREHKLRSEAGSDRREKARLEREVSRLKKDAPGKTDDVLALLEG